MEETYIVLRDLSTGSTNEVFTGGSHWPGGLRTSTPSEPKVDVLDLDKGEVLDLARDPRVVGMARPMPTRSIEPVGDDDAGDAGDAGPADGGATWGVGAIGAADCELTGEGVTVAVLDTGIDRDHPAFAGMTLVEKDFSGDGDGDPQGHGTHCAGTVFGRDVDGTRIGVAPGVTTGVIGKVLGDQGGGDSDMLFRGIQWAMHEGAQVISMSLGFDFPGLVDRLAKNGWPVDLATSRALELYRANLRVFDALMQLAQNQQPFTGGTVVVAAAGNESKRQVRPDYEIGASLPAAAEGVVSTGALGRSSGGKLVIAPFSNTFPQISAPGVGVRSARTGGGLRDLNGTSMATPHVAGAAALWWQHVKESNLPAVADTVRANLLARADTSSLAHDVEMADRGVGLVRVP